MKRLDLLLAGCCLASALAAPALRAQDVDWAAAVDTFDAASECDSLDSVPITFYSSQIEYQSGIQGIFDNYCISCHTNGEDGDQMPSGGLSLDPGVSWANIVNRHSSGKPSLYRVVPNHPELSVLFHKVNCMVPDVGSRMPFGRLPLSLDEQAILSDWIMAGAPVGQTDVIFLSTFGPRG